MTPTAPAPPVSQLAEVFAEDRATAIAKIEEHCRTAVDWPVVWVHVLVWTEGEQTGFESTQVR